MAILRCIKNLKLDGDVDEKAVILIENDKTGYSQGSFWLKDELYEVTGWEENDLLTQYPEYFERI